MSTLTNNQFSGAAAGNPPQKRPHEGVPVMSAHDKILYPWEDRQAGTNTEISSFNRAEIGCSIRRAIVENGSMSEKESLDELKSRIADELDISAEDVSKTKLMELIAKSMRGVAEGEDALDVRKGSESLEELVEHQGNEDPHIRLQMFLLRTIIDDMWDNIAMESSVRIHDDVIDTVLENISRHIERISRCYAAEDYQASYEYFANLYVDYLRWVRAMSNAFEDGNKQEVVK